MAAIRHLDGEYSLDHLSPSQGSFEWLDKATVRYRFSVHVRYSPHCYSETIDGDIPEAAYTFGDSSGTRMFSIDRHAHSLLVPGMIHALFSKPTSAVGLTYEDNWSIYSLQMQPPMEPGKTFYIFFRLRKSDPPLADGNCALELYVESAYARSTPVHIRQRMTFGAAALAAHKK